MVSSFFQGFGTENTAPICYTEPITIDMGDITMTEDLSLNIEPMHFQKILVGVDESQQGHVALANAIHQAIEDDATLYIASILELGELSAVDVLNLPAVQMMQDNLAANLDRYKAYAESHGVKQVEVVYDSGQRAGEVLVDVLAPKIGADLIIIGAHSKKGFWESLGSQAVYVARHAKVSSVIARCDTVVDAK